MAIIIVGLMPISQHHRRTFGDSYRGKCLSNLHQIGLGILLYCGDHAGAYPDSLQSLLLNEQLIPEMFICPSSNNTPSTAPTTQAQAEELAAGGHVSYIYLGKGLTDKTVGGNWIIAYEALENHVDEINVLLGNGESEGLDSVQSAKVIAAAKTGVRPLTFPR